MKSSYARLAGIGYFVAAVLVLFPVIDLTANLWPLDPGRVSWRYGAYMLLSGFVLTVLLGMALAVLMGRIAGHRRTTRVLAVLNVLAGLVLVAAAVAFTLDALQIRAGVTGEARTQFGIGAVKSLLKNTVVGVGLLWIGWVAWRDTRRSVHQRGSGTKAPLGTG